MTSSSNLHNHPVLVIVFALLCSGASLALVMEPSQQTTHNSTDVATQSAEPIRHFAVNRSRITTDTLPVAREVFNNTSSPDTAFVFKQRDGATLVGHGVTQSSGEFQSPATTLKLIDDTGTESIVTDEPVEYSNLSSDGTKTIYITTDKKTYLYDNATKTSQLITDRAAFLPDLCSNNSEIVYKELPEGWTPGSDYTNSRGLFTKNIVTGVETQLTSYDAALTPDNANYSFIGENSYSPTYTPDCTQIVYFKGSTTGNIGGMFIMNADGTNQTRLTNNDQKQVTANTVPSISDSPVFSPDGNTFAYESNNQIIKTTLDRKSRKLTKLEKLGTGMAPDFDTANSNLRIRQKGEKVRLERRQKKVNSLEDQIQQIDSLQSPSEDVNVKIESGY